MRLWQGGGDRAKGHSNHARGASAASPSTGGAAAGGSRSLLVARVSRGDQSPGASAWPQSCSSSRSPASPPSSAHCNGRTLGLFFPDLPPIQALLRTSDILAVVLSMLNPADRVSLLSVSKWIRHERHAVIQELDLRMPPLPTSGKAGDGEGGGFVVGPAGLPLATIETARAVLRAAPHTRRLRYRGDVEVFTHALDGVRLARLVSLDLCECNMTAMGARQLACALRAGLLPRVQHLDLSDNPSIGEDGGEALGHALRAGGAPRLQGLLLFGSKIRGRGGMAVAGAIAADALPFLEILDLSGNAIGTAAVLELAAALYDRRCCSLEQLGLSDNEVGPEAIRGLARALRRRGERGIKPACSPLSKLHLGGNHVGVEAARDLAEVLRIEACGGRLALLELHSAKLTGQGVREMAAAFKAGACPALKELWLDDNVDSEEEAVTDVIEVLRGGALPSLEALGLNWTAMGSQGAEALCEALRAEPRPSLQRLDLRSTSITPEGVAALGQALAAGSLPSLRWLDLSGNAIFREGARELAAALASGGGRQLRRLDLHAVGLEGEGMSLLAHSMTNGCCCPEMQGLGLALNHMGPSGGRALARALSLHAFPKLVGLELHKNDLGCGGAAAIAKSLSAGAAPLLIYLGLSTNAIGDEGARHLAAMLRSNSVAHMERLNMQDNAMSRSGRRAIENAALALSKLRGRGGPRLKLEMTGNEGRNHKGSTIEMVLRGCRAAELPVLLSLLGLLALRGCTVLRTLQQVGSHDGSSSFLTADEWLSVAMGSVGSLAAGIMEGKAVSTLCGRISDARPGLRADSFAVALILGMALGLIDFYACRHLFLTCSTCLPLLPATTPTMAAVVDGSCDVMEPLWGPSSAALPTTSAAALAAVGEAMGGQQPGGELTALAIISVCFVAGFVMQLERARRQL